MAGNRTIPRVIVAVLSLAQFTTTLEFSIVFIALPSIAAELNLSAAMTQWIPNGYAVVFAGLLLLGGRLTDRLGARPLFLLAIAGFGLASALGAVATHGATLIAARCLQGASVALLQPAILALLGGHTTDAGRSRAFAVWSAVGAAGLGGGVILGGLLTELSWRLTFLINVPLTAACALGAALVLRRGAAAAEQARIPVRGAVLGTVSVLALVCWLTIGAEQSWTAPVALCVLATTVLCAAAFLRHERSADPDTALLSPALRRIGTLRVGAAATALYMASAGSAYYLLTLLLQSTRDYSPLEAGLAFLPLAAMVTVGSVVARLLPVVTALGCGFAVVAVGLGWLALASGDGPAALLPGLVLSGLGNGVVFTAMFLVGTRAVPEGQRGTAGALLTTTQYVSSAVAVALLTVVLGESPQPERFRVAFLLTAALAAIGVLLAITRGRQAAGR